MITFPPASLRVALPVLAGLVATTATLSTPLPAHAAGSVVAVQEQPDGRWTLLRDGKPFFIRGGGGWTHLDVLRECGGNSIRTWGADGLAKKTDGKTLLDRAQELGIAVTVGIWVAHARHGFDYSDPAALQRQRESVRATVMKYRDHPALLIWGLGNEAEGPNTDGRDPRVWKELNVLAGIVKEMDRNHPVMTAIAGASDTRIQAVLQHYPNLDILGINAYGPAAGTAATLRRLGWKKPWVLTEFGPRGHWEVAKTGWNAPIEPSEQEKTASYSAALRHATEDAAGWCLGSYAFMWAAKQEKTATWFSMFLPTGEKLPPVDAVSHAWTGRWPANRCPRIDTLTSPIAQKSTPPHSTHAARVEVQDPDGDPVQIEWSVMTESWEHKDGGDAEMVPPSHPECIVSQKDGEVVFKAPSKPGGYRLFVTVRDGKGAASAGNFPFQVK